MNNKRGAGRPPKGGQKRERIDARLPVEMVEWMKANGGVTAAIEKAIAAAMKTPPIRAGFSVPRVSCELIIGR